MSSTPPRGYRPWPIVYALAVTRSEPFGKISEKTHAIAERLHAAGHISLQTITALLMAPGGRLRVLALLHEAGAAADAGRILSYSQLGCRIKVVWKQAESDVKGVPYVCIVQEVHPNGALTVRCLADQALYEIHPDLDEIEFEHTNTAMILDTSGIKYEGHFSARGLAHGKITITQNTATPTPPTVAVYDKGRLVSSP